jgi:hypothetical protein
VQRARRPCGDFEQPLPRLLEIDGGGHISARFVPPVPLMPGRPTAGPAPQHCKSCHEHRRRAPTAARLWAALCAQ